MKRARTTPGALQELKDLLYELYLEAAAPRLDEIASWVADDDQLAGAPSRDTIGRILSDDALPPSQPDVIAVATVLARVARWDEHDIALRARLLWVQARMAVPIGTPIADLTDPFVFEVHKPIAPDHNVDEFPPLPEYLPREHDDQLKSAIDQAIDGNSMIVVLVGGPSTGKTRACWEAIQRLPKDWRLWHPIFPSRAEGLACDVQKIGPRTVLWLNETQEYLLTPSSELGERAAAGLRELLRDRTRGPVLVLGTTWPDHWAELTETKTRKPGAHTQAAALLEGSSIEVPNCFTKSVVDSLLDSADTRLAQAARHAQHGQIAQYLAGIPALLERYHTAPASAKALIHTAMDVQRVGHSLAVPRPVLAYAAPAYISDQQWNLLNEDWLEHALAYTSEPCVGGHSALARIRPRPGQPASEPPSYRLADYLAHIAWSQRRALPVPKELWDALLLAHDTNNVVLGDEAEKRGLYRYAFLFYAIAAKLQEPYASANLFSLLRQTGRIDEAITWFRARADAGDIHALGWLAQALREAGHIDEAITTFQNAAETGDTNAMKWATRLLVTEGRAAEVTTWLNNLVSNGNTHAQAQLVELSQAYSIPGVELNAPRRLIDQPNETSEEDPVDQQQLADAAQTRSAPAASAPDKPTRDYAPTDYVAERIARLKASAEAGDIRALEAALRLLVDVGQADEAIDWLRTLAEAGNETARDWMADALGQLGRIDDMIAWLTTHNDIGGFALERAADLLHQRDRTEAAITFYQRAAESGGAYTNWEVATFTAKVGVKVEVTFLCNGAAGGRRYAQWQAVDLLHRAGRTDDAIAWLHARAEVGHSDALEQAGLVLLNAGRYQESIALHCQASEADSMSHSLDTLTSPWMTRILNEQGYTHQLELIRRYGIEPGGHPAQPWTLDIANDILSL